MYGLLGNNEERFSRDEAQTLMKVFTKQNCCRPLRALPYAHYCEQY